LPLTLQEPASVEPEWMFNLVDRSIIIRHKEYFQLPRIMNVYVWKRLCEGKSLISPDDFITWAKKDIKGGDRRSIANALTNTKRAIHARIDEILYALRVQYANDWPPSPKTSEKLKVLKRLSIPVTSIVEVLTKRRNDLEHSYFLPSLEQVRADVETADLWLEKSKSY